MLLSPENVRLHDREPEVLHGQSENMHGATAGSRLNLGAKSRYAPIKSEAQAVAWALEQTEPFTQGCKKLTVATDPKPFIALPGAKSLDRMPSGRTFCAEQRISVWTFEIAHHPRRANFLASAEEDDAGTASLTADLAATSITMEDVASAAKDDRAHWGTCLAPSANTTPSPSKCKECHPYRDRLYARGEALIHNDQLLIPDGVRGAALDVIHAAHQAGSFTLHKTVQSAFWPGCAAVSKKEGASCHTCKAIATPQQLVPVEQSEPPTTPFEGIATDFVDLAGDHYPVAVDRLLGWLYVTRATPDWTGSGAKGPTKCRRLLFTDKGVPDFPSSDGGT